MKVRAALAWLCLASCTRSASGYYGTTEPKHGPTEVWTNLGTEPETIDPGKAAENSGGAIITNIFAGLTQPHPVTLEAMPDVAERWDISPDGMRYTFHLRSSTWSDGTPLTAADYEYAWRRVLDPRTASKYSSFLFGLKYGEQFNLRALVVRGVGALSEASLRELLEQTAPVESVRFAPELDAAFVVVGGEESARPKLRKQLLRELVYKNWHGYTLDIREFDPALVGVHARDAHTLEVELEAPLPYFLHITKYYTAMPVPRHVLERLERAGKNTDLWTRPEHIVSNGPFTLEQAKFRQSMLLTKNPRYWDASHTKLEHVKLLIIDGANTVLNMYEAGELDSIGPTSALPLEFLDLLRTKRDFHASPSLAMYFYWLNTKAPPVDDVRVRSALSLAVDRQSLVTNVLRGGQIPTADMVPTGLSGYPGLHSPIFDPERARQLLIEAGYGPQHPFPKITLRYNTAESHRQIAEAVQAMWRKNLGVEVELENQEWKVYLKSLQAHEFQVARQGWIGDYPDPHTFLELMSSHNGNNHSAWQDPRYDALLERANRQLDPRRRRELLMEAERIAMDAVPVLPLYVYTRSELLKPYVRGHAINYETRHLFKYWWIDTRWYDGVPSTTLPDDFPAASSGASGGH